MLALEVGARRRGSSAGRAVRALLDRIRPAPVADDTLEGRVRKKLARAVRDPSAITVSIEHGCVDLRGPVETRDRARIVRAVASVPGVDSVLDLMTEPARPRAAAAARAIAPSHRVPWRPVARVLAAGTGIGVTIAAIGSGGVFAIPAAALGLLLVTGAATRISSPLRASPPA